MCGIVGTWNFGIAGRAETERKLATVLPLLHHRGPDSSGTWNHPRLDLVFGHTRLAIIDLSPTGDQPMHSSESNVLIFNGEIYNHRTLRAELASEGYSFRGHSDTEVLLEMLNRHWLSTLPRLHGMFALAYWNEARRTLLLARDRIGKKPLYYLRSGSRIMFASELPTLVQLAQLFDQRLNLSEEGIDYYLSHGTYPVGTTVYREVFELPPSSYITLSEGGRAESGHYWSCAQSATRRGPTDKNEAAKQLVQHLEDAVAIRMEADVPVGVFLSGGIDSGLITALASRHCSTPLRTFCVGSESPERDERRLARLVADRYRTEHTEILIQPSLEPDGITRTITAYGQPLADPSIVPARAVAAEASKYVKVVLNGDGGDELFGGYRRSLAARSIDLVSSIAGRSGSCALSRSLLALIRYSGRMNPKIARVARILEVLSLERDEQIVGLTHNGFTRMEKALLYRDSKPYYRDGVSSKPAQGDTLSLLLRNHDLFSSLPDTLLKKMDIATMSASIEARSPFLDQTLVEWALSLPPELISYGWTTKPLLRYAARGLLPEEVVRAPKRGFEIPLTEWLDGPLREYCRDQLLSGAGFCTHYFRREQIERLLSGNWPEGRPERRAILKWTLLVLEVWYNQSAVRSIPSPTEVCVSL